MRLLKAPGSRCREGNCDRCDGLCDDRPQLFHEGRESARWQPCNGPQPPGHIRTKTFINFTADINTYMIHSDMLGAATHCICRHLQFSTCLASWHSRKYHTKVTHSPLVRLRIHVMVSCIRGPAMAPCPIASKCLKCQTVRPETPTTTNKLKVLLAARCLQ